MVAPPISYLFESALKAILEANAGILKIYEHKQQLDIGYKNDKSPVTQADKISSDIICKILSETGIPVICEETGQESYTIRKSWKYFWLVDPLDGTKEFIKRNGEFTVNIALIQSKTPVMGLISIPVKGLLYWGDIHHGAFKIKIDDIKHTNYNNLLNQAKKLPVHKKPDALRVMVSRSHMDNKTLAFLADLKTKHKTVKTIAAGSSLKFCYLAEGKADIYVRYSPTMEWDTAAGHAIVLASGAKIKNLPGMPNLSYNKKNLRNKGFIVYRKE